VNSGLATLRAVPMFERLDATLLTRLDAITAVTHLPPGHLLCRQGEQAAHLHILLDGQVALSGIAPDGAETVLEVAQPVSHFVLAAVLTDMPYLMSARTVTRSRVLMLPAPGLRALTRTEPALALALLGAMARDYRAMVRQVRDLRLRTAAQRLGCYLLALVAEAPGNTARLRLPFDKALLASRLGCRQDSLSRAFATLREYGVETHGAAVALHNIAALQAFALPDELADLPTDPG